MFRVEGSHTETGICGQIAATATATKGCTISKACKDLWNGSLFQYYTSHLEVPSTRRHFRPSLVHNCTRRYPHTAYGLHCICETSTSLTFPNFGRPTSNNCKHQTSNTGTPKSPNPEAKANVTFRFLLSWASTINQDPHPRIRGALNCNVRRSPALTPHQ